jgi:hypothetical protein
MQEKQARLAADRARPESVRMTVSVWLRYKEMASMTTTAVVARIMNGERRVRSAMFI